MKLRVELTEEEIRRAIQSIAEDRDPGPSWSASIEFCDGAEWQPLGETGVRTGTAIEIRGVAEAEIGDG